MLNHPKSYIHSVYSSHDMLAFPVNKVITNIDFATQTFTWVEKSRLLSDLAVSPDQFLDLAILSGFELCPTFPPFADAFFLRAIVDLFRVYKTGLSIVTAHAEHPAVKNDGLIKGESYLDRFIKTRAAVKYSLVLTAEQGRVLPLPLAIAMHDQTGSTPITAVDVPSDLSDAFSFRLPDELYYHVSRGFASPTLIGWLTTGMIIEAPPICSGETIEYKKFIKDVITNNYTAPRCTALALLASALHPQWSQTRVGIHYYFDNVQMPSTGSTVNFNTQQTRNLVDRCLSWQVPCIIVEDELRQQNSSTIDFKLCLGATHSDEGARRTRTPSKMQARQLEKKDEIVANVIWRFLDLRG